MAKKEGNSAEAEAFTNQANDLKKRPYTEGGGVLPLLAQPIRLLLLIPLNCPLRRLIARPRPTRRI